MSNARKLQTEIDRVLKKVDEGAELFDETWLKVQSADSQNLKEKHEIDLKKEIKKLQRLRDQIKTWVSSSEVKDKDALVEARKLIETKMEQFKICEKETKTKTYSKEGLAREDKLDPAEESKMRTTSWIAEYVERFREQVEEKEFDIEKLSSGKGKKTNKNQIEQLQLHIAHHKHHVAKLDGIVRLINNDVLETDGVDAIQEDLDYYLDSYQEEEYAQAYDQDFFYESLGLEELDLIQIDRITQPPPAGGKKADDATETSSKEGSKETKNGKKAASSSVIPLTIGRARSKAEKKADKEREDNEARLLAAASPVKKTVTSPQSAPVPPVVIATPPPPVPPGASMAAILKRETEQQEKERQKQEQLRLHQIKQQEQQRLQEAIRAQQQQQQQQAAQDALQRQQQESLRVQQAQQLAAQEVAAQQAAAQLQAQQRAAAEQKAQSLQNQQMQQQQAKLDLLASGLGGLGLGGSIDSRSTDASNLGALGTVSQTTEGISNPLSTGNVEVAGSSYFSALNESFAAAPSLGDNERSRKYTPQNPYPAPASYPAAPSAIFDNPSVFEKLGTDCLFFIFYYAQGTYQQYLAARELKKQSWRFHKKYMTWFQRHEEPKITTDEYEQGTYVYFDYETGWCTRIKQDFRFEYSFLEDSLQ